MKAILVQNRCNQMTVESKK